MIRYFTKDLEIGNYLEYSGYDVPRKRVDVKITDGQTGKTIFEIEGAEFPEGYSQQACDIIASKYFRVINEYGDRETSFFQVADRMVDFWSQALLEEGILQSMSEAHDFELEVKYMLSHQIFAPNSPQWFNTGVANAYCNVDLSNYKGMYHWSEFLERPIETTRIDAERYSQTSACFIMSVEDSLLGNNSITDHYVTETKLFKGGSGVGTNFSTLRGEGERLSKGGSSSGVMSFLEGLDRNAGAIKSGGTTRRAAKMVILDIDHPEIEEFINWKAREEKKAYALMEKGYSGGMDGEAYRTVSGQNSNNSVRLSKEFMDLVLDLDKNPDATITLRGREDHTVDRIVSVKKLWDEIAQAAWECADPGVQFDDRYNEWNTCAADGRINATNPCSEYAFLDNSACNLASINVYPFYDQQTHSFDFAGFRQAVKIGQMILEASVENGHYPTEEICMNSHLYRPTGLGLTNLASLFLAMGIPYDSVEARRVAGALAAIMTGDSYFISHVMASQVGPFERYEYNKADVCKVLRLHKSACDHLVSETVTNPCEDMLIEEFVNEAALSWGWLDIDEEDLGLGRYGIRNAQVTVMAPTGTISFAMDCGSTGIEPFYSHTMYKKCSDGSYMEITNPLYDPNLPADVLATANEISPLGHLKMMAAMQPFISGSISKTVNMAHDVTVEDVQEVYLEAYKMGLKSVAIYRDGSKGAQPLVTDLEDDDDDQIILEVTGLGSDDPKEFLEGLKGSNKAIKFNDDRVVPKRIKPEGIRNSRTHAAKIGNVELYITVGYYEDGTLAELFASSDKDGTVVKGLLSSLSKAISYMLQYGIEPLTIAKMLRNQRYEPSGIVERHPNVKMADSISDLIARVIEMECGDYSRCHVVPDEKPQSVVKADTNYTEEICPTCGSVNMVQSGTCKTCVDCGSTTGCG